MSGGGGAELSLDTVGITDSTGTVKFKYIAPLIKNMAFLAGDVRIMVGHPGGNTYAKITVIPPAPVITGRVLDYRGTPIRDLPVQARSNKSGKTLSAATDKDGRFAIPISENAAHSVQIGNKWTGSNDRLFVLRKGVMPNDSLGDVIYATVEEHYLRNAANMKKLEAWYNANIVQAGVRGLSTSDLWELSRRAYTIIWERQNSASIVDRFHAAGYGRVGRCGDISLYIIREFRKYFSNNPEMNELSLMEFSVEDAVSNHVAPIVIPSVIEFTERRAFFDYGSLTDPVKRHAIILDAYDQDRKSATKSYDQWVQKYKTSVENLTN